MITMVVLVISVVTLGSLPPDDRPDDHPNDGETGPRQTLGEGRVQRSNSGGASRLDTKPQRHLRRLAHRTRRCRSTALSAGT